MTAQRKIVCRYLDIFCSGRDLDRMYDCLSDDCSFSGPLFACSTSEEYVKALKADPPVDCSYRLRHVFEDGPLVHVIYVLIKPGLEMKMSQLFEVVNGKIVRIELIFDSRPLIN